MSRYYSYINTARRILEQYEGSEPFSSFLKKFFAASKKFGSKDRKQISHLCYCYFRMGKAAATFPVEERILGGLFLCSDKPSEILATLRPEWNDKVNLGISKKCSIVDAQYVMFNTFPWKEQLSDGIDHEKFCESFFIQPGLFLRLRPGKEDLVKQKLTKAGIPFFVLADGCLALSNAAKVDTVIELNNEAVIQDFSSQKVGEFYELVRQEPSGRVWDCCAASGGKSIMLYDLTPNIRLTVSDIRESILVNLKKRFKEAGITKYEHSVVDLTKAQHPTPHSHYDLIIADVPCTGSGTWSRTPEQLYFFNESKIAVYTALQKKIISNVIPQLKKGGHLLYITCSVFKKENEEVVNFIQEKFQLQLIKMEVLKGYELKADTMFAALLSLPEHHQPL